MLIRSCARSFAPDEFLFQVGDRAVPTWFLLEGSVELFGRDGFDDETSLRQLESGQFTGELSELANRPSLTGAKAGSGGCVVLPLNASRLRALIVGSAELGEGVRRGVIRGEAVAFARDLINTPPSDLPPRVLAERAADRLRGLASTTVEVWDEQRIRDAIDLSSVVQPTSPARALDVISRREHTPDTSHGR